LAAPPLLRALDQAFASANRRWSSHQCRDRCPRRNGTGLAGPVSLINRAILWPRARPPVGKPRLPCSEARLRAAPPGPGWRRGPDQVVVKDNSRVSAIRWRTQMHLVADHWRGAGFGLGTQRGDEAIEGGGPTGVRRRGIPTRQLHHPRGRNVFRDPTRI